MVKIIALDHEGNEIGKAKYVTDAEWKALLKFGKTLRWKEIKPIKKTKNERRKRSDSGNAVKKA